MRCKARGVSDTEQMFIVIIGEANSFVSLTPRVFNGDCLSITYAHIFCMVFSVFSPLGIVVMNDLARNGQTNH